MNIRKIKTFVFVSALITILLIATTVVLLLLESFLAHSALFGDHMREFAYLVAQTFNFGAWPSNLYLAEKSIAIIAFILSAMVIIIGWISWIYKTKRYISIIYVVLFFVLVICTFYYAELFDGHLYFIRNGEIYNIALAIVLTLSILSMSVLFISSLILDYHILDANVLDSNVMTSEEVLAIRQIVFSKNEYDYVEDDVSTKRIVVIESIKEEVVTIEETQEEVVIIKETRNNKVDDIPPEIFSEPNTLIDGNFGKKKPRPPFALRLRRGEDHIRELYNELKAEFLSYSLNSRISLNGDSFRLHAKTYAVIQVVGKSLKINFALDCKDYVDSAVPFTDSGAQKRYKDVPFTFKVRSNLSIKRAKELIKDTVTKDGITQENEPIRKNYSREAIETLRTSKYYLNNFARKQ